jgi:hypothetical protein
LRPLRRPVNPTLLVLVLLCMTGCGALNSTDTRGTLAAEATAFVDESTQIALSINQRATQVAATAAIARTDAAFIDGVNVQLAATMRAAIPPTQQIIANSGPITPGMMATLDTPRTADPNVPTADPAAVNQLTQVGVALAVREADGCAASLQSSVSATAPRIYATTRILNAAGGTAISASWSSAGQVVYSNSAYQIPQDDDDFCLWFYIEPTDVTFSPGDWQVQFLVNNQPVGAPAAFTMTP